jgi:hypothetical protein
MDPETPAEATPDDGFCPECGIEESGYFCRSCGALLHGRKMALCPRCRHVVPNGSFCNQCGQSLIGVALNLEQLDIAGDDFWVTDGDASSQARALGSSKAGVLDADDLLIPEDAELPDWLRDLTARPVPAEPGPRIHPSLRPIGAERGPRSRNTFFTVAILLMFVLMLGLVFLTFLVVLRGGL